MPSSETQAPCSPFLPSSLGCYPHLHGQSQVASVFLLHPWPGERDFGGGRPTFLKAPAQISSTHIPLAEAESDTLHHHHLPFPKLQRRLGNGHSSITTEERRGCFDSQLAVSATGTFPFWYLQENSNISPSSLSFSLPLSLCFSPFLPLSCSLSFSLSSEFLLLLGVVIK